MEGDAIDLPSSEVGAPVLNLEYEEKAGSEGGPMMVGWLSLRYACHDLAASSVECVCSQLPPLSRLWLPHSNATRDSCIYLQWLSTPIFLRHVNVEKRVLTFEIQAIVS